MATKQFAVIGLGRFGSSVASTLYGLGFDVMGIDADEGRTQAMINSITHVVQADATDDEALRTLGLRNFDVVVVAVGELQASILATLILKELGVRFVVVKASNDLHGRVLERIGADRVVFPERDMGVRLGHNLASTSVLDYIELSPDYSLVELTAGGQVANHTLRDLNLRARFGINVLALRKGEEIKVSPGGDDVVSEGDIMVIVGSNEDIARLERLRDG